MKRPKHIICQILGINTADYDTILNEAEKEDWLIQMEI